MPLPKRCFSSPLGLLPLTSTLLISHGWMVPSSAQTQLKTLPTVKFHNLAVQPEDEITVPPETGAVISEIQVRFLNKAGDTIAGKTKPYIILREFDLQSGDVYDEFLAREGLERLVKLDSIKQAQIALEPTSSPSEVVMVIDVVETGSFFINFATRLDPPSALLGPVQPATVLPDSGRSSAISGGVILGFQNLGGNDQNLTLGVQGGSDTLGFDLRFTDPWIGGDPHRTGYSLNFFHSQSSELPVFENGERDVDLPNGDDPWVHRIGGGIEFFRPLTPDFKAALGLSYQQVSVRDDIFSKTLEPVDELGNSLTFSDRGIDDLLTLTFAGALDRRDRPQLTHHGYRFLFSTDQSIPVGEASLFFNRLAANYTQYIPVPLFGFSEGPRTLVLNVQGGTVIGDIPPYAAYSLGGSNSVRGYEAGEIGSGRSFLQATAEYRFPITNLRLFSNAVHLRGALFVDYATDLGSGDTVTGQPAEVRDKPGSGLGYGLGLRADTVIGPIRVEFGLNDQGDNQFLFFIGDRF